MYSTKSQYSTPDGRWAMAGGCVMMLAEYAYDDDDDSGDMTIDCV